MKTKFAIAFYYIAISFLVACAATIVVKLIFWPPCTQIGNTCAIDPWSTAGLAGTVLAVSATVLAILGAVAVAAWWTSLNNRVNDQVKKLYETQKAEINTQVDTILADQREKVDVQLDGFQTSFHSLEASIRLGEFRLKQLRKSTQEVEDMAIEGITSVFAAGFMEQWAQKATQGQRFPKIVLKMTENYLNDVENELSKVEGTLVNVESTLEYRDDFFRTNFLKANLASGTNQYTVPSLQSFRAEIKESLEGLTGEYTPLVDTFTNWEGAERWLSTGMSYGDFNMPEDDEFAASFLQQKERFEGLAPRVEQLRQNRERLVTKAETLLEEVETYIAARQNNVTPQE